MITRDTAPPATWHTARLTADRATRADADELFAEYATDAEVAKLMTWRPHRTVEETRAFLERCEAFWSDGSAFPWVLRLTSDGTCIGMIEARIHAHSVDIGYGLARRFWRQGFMREAAGAVIDWAFDQPTIHRVWATCSVENAASAGLLESVGMHREGVLRRWVVFPNISEVPRDCFCYSIVK